MAFPCTVRYTIRCGTHLCTTLLTILVRNAAPDVCVLEGSGARDSSQVKSRQVVICVERVHAVPSKIEKASLQNVKARLFVLSVADKFRLLLSLLDTKS